jgi:hypothetical protein
VDRVIDFLRLKQAGNIIDDHRIHYNRTRQSS